MAPGWPSMLAAGAAGAYVASNADKSGMSDYMRGFAKTVGLELPSSSGRPFSSSSGSEMQVLQSEVDRLHKLLGDVVRGQRGGGYTVIHTGRGGAISLLVYPVVIGGVVYLYMRWRGLGLSDFMYVTRSSLTNFRSTITESFTKIWEEMRKQKDEFMQRIGAVGAQQQQLMQQQTAMDDRLKHVGSNVEDIRYTADQIGHRVELLDNKMAEVGDGVQRANHGILLLCAAVAEVTKRVGMDARSNTHQMLHSYVQSAPQGAVQALNAPGLRSLLEDAPSSSSMSMSAVTVTDVSGMGMLTSASSVPVEGSAAGLPPVATGGGGTAQRGRTGSLPFLWHSSSNAGAGLAAASGTASARLAHS